MPSGGVALGCASGFFLQHGVQTWDLDSPYPIALCRSLLLKQTFRLRPYKGKWKTFSSTSKGGVLEKSLFSSGGIKCSN